MEVVESGMKFKKEKVSSLLGHTEVRYTEQSMPGGFVVIATPWDVQIEGKGSLQSMGDLQAFAKAMSDAWVSHLSLKPKLSTTTSGH